MTKRKIKKAYTRTRVTTENSSNKTRCVQSERKNSDINNIVGRAYQTGMMPTLNREALALPTALSYQESLNKIVSANQAFERLPSQIRDEFSNNPENLLTAVEQSKSNPELKSKLQQLGVLNTPVNNLVGSADEKPVDAPVQPVVEDDKQTNA